MGKCESYDDRKGTYQTKWLPASSELRAIAERHVATVEWRIKVLDDILRERSELPKRRDLDNEGFRKIGNGLALDIEAAMAPRLTGAITNKVSTSRPSLISWFSRH